ncbi:plexin domain-containing protein 2-like [Girardinichthys multiradiatus]|uniref:plexin domain-containing protein 2-like n=1 Tax=Girardinichthys multiradiatus TaxID=208333 RepID=UPI001FAE6DF5|nr:plexin domain-containing protein 2-like [Girardinichthys multiradiatus]
MATITAVHLITSLILVQQIQTSFKELSLEGRLHAVTEDLQNRHQTWASKPRPRDPMLALYKHGHYREQHKPEESQPKLLEEEGQQKANRIVDIDHVYYTSKVYGPGDAPSKYLWVNISEMKREEWKVFRLLSSTHRQTERVNLSFSFPFYGHLLKEITIATGGFIYTGDVPHQMLAATQYIAPLMANFDTSLSKNSTMLYYDNGTALVVQWNQVHLQDISLGTFTFQVTLHSDGRIIFAYKEIPVDINDINSKNHPIKVGLSDAFMVLHNIEQIHNVRRRTIYEYHRVNILKSKISNSTAVEMLPLPTCLQFSSCGPCATSQIGFNCSWCSRLQRCSSGFDRNRQEWVDFGCPERQDPECLPMKNVKDGTSHPMKHLSFPFTSTSKQMKILNMTSTPFSRTSTTNKLSSHSGNGSKDKSSEQQPANTSADDGNTESIEESGKAMPGGVLAGLIIMMIVLLAAVLMSTYMYNHPTSSASLFLMERRSTHWPILKFRRGSSRPSYAEVETPGQDIDGSVIIDFKQSFVISDRRESEQREGFIVPDQRERFLAPESS